MCVCVCPLLLPASDNHHRRRGDEGADRKPPWPPPPPPLPPLPLANQRGERSVPPPLSHFLIFIFLTVSSSVHFFYFPDWQRTNSESSTVPSGMGLDKVQLTFVFLFVSLRETSTGLHRLWNIYISSASSSTSCPSPWTLLLFVLGRKTFMQGPFFLFFC